MVEADGSEDVNDFLLRIRELGNKRDKEDEERTKRLEEEIIQGRKERQARRAERARSISPTKDSPASSYTPTSNHAIAQSQSPAGVAPRSMEPQRETAEPERRRPTLGQKPDGSPSPSTSTNALSRGGTLSWQQRPNSRGSTGPTSRPLSSVAVQDSASSLAVSEPKVGKTETNAPSRTQIAQSLASKDPTWFKQTPDRGLGSAALRQNGQVPDAERGGGAMRLPGMSGALPKGSEKFLSTAESIHSSSPSLITSDQDFMSSSTGAVPRSLASSLSSPLPVLESQRLEPPTDTSSLRPSESTSARNFAMSPSQGRISPEKLSRPSSPTKGLGGFVQSAMLKRSDSVSKRWSAQGGLGLSRGNSIASNNAALIPQPNRDTDVLGTSTAEGSDDRAFVKPELPDHSGKFEGKPHESRRSSTESAERSAPASPSRALESKKWSPSKERTWLDNALSKTDSPKPKAPPPQQPSWMAEINKAKQSRGSADMGSNTVSREVPVGASLRSPYLGAALKTSKEGDSTKTSAPIPAKLADVAANPGINKESVGIDQKPQSRTTPSSVENSGRLSKGSESSILDSTKVKPTVAPKKDFRSTLKPRQLPGQSESSNEPEFKNVFGKLKKTETKNYVAPDELKSNILRGKAGLAVTDGPKKSERVDEFKESILKKKEEMKQPGGVSIGTVRKPSSGRPDPDSSVPEAIAKRKALGRSGSSQTSNISTFKDQTSSPGSSGRQATPTQTSKVGVPEKKLTAPGRLQAEASSGNKLADRFNPALAGVLARGIPSPCGPARTMSASPTGFKDTDTRPITTAQQESCGSAQLTHATKDRGKGPKRRPPKSVQAGSPLETPSEATGHGSGVKSSDVASAKAPGLSSPRNEPPVKVSQRPLSGVTASDNNRQHASLSSQISQPSDVSNAITMKSQTLDSSSSRKDPLSPRQALLSRQISRPQDGSSATTMKTEPPDGSLSRKGQLSPKQAPLSSDISRPSDSSNTTTTKPKTLDSSSSQKDQSSPRPAPVSSQFSRSSDVSDATSTKPQTLNSPLSRKDQLSPKPKPITPPKPSPTVAREAAPRKPSTSVPQTHLAISPASTEGPATPLVTSDQDSPAVSKKDEDENSPSVLATAAKWDAGSSSTSQRSGMPRSPIKLPTHRDAAGFSNESSLKKEPIKEPIGLGIQPFNKEPASITTRSLPSPPMDSPRSPPLPPKKTDSMFLRIASNGSSASPPPTVGPVSLSKASSAPKPMASNGSSATPLPAASTIPSKKSSTAPNPFADLFENSSAPKSKATINTQSILTQRTPSTPSGKIRTLRKQIWEITGDGKKLPIPAQQEHILYEASMYLCTHVFDTPNAKTTTEVYLWCGDAISPSSIEDAQLFCRNTVREVGGKFIILHQGKETGNFFEALGGIVITRRGSSARFGGSAAAAATYMLCGRRHMGQIAFDEVDFAPSSLCSGFPYIVSATSGRLFLWKGKGSDADELGCARLIGMDLGLTGEIEEIDEGCEPEAFWKAFPGQNGKRTVRSENEFWKLKAGCEKYATRLFGVELETRPKSAASFMWGMRGSAATAEEVSEAVIRELSPYAQKDLDNKGVYVLDAFFEVWVMFGNQTRSKFQTLRTALLFAQEYAILAASMEDRPRIPVGGVVLRGTPAGVKSAFRKWEGPVETKEPVVVPLNEALEAIDN